MLFSKLEFLGIEWNVSIPGNLIYIQKIYEGNINITQPNTDHYFSLIQIFFLFWKFSK